MRFKEQGGTIPADSPENVCTGLTAADFEKARVALEKANVKGPFVKLTSEGFIWDDGHTASENTITYTPTGDGGSAPRVR